MNTNSILPRKKGGFAGKTILLKKFLSKNSKEFCNSTTLHGLKYVVDEDLHPVERLFFALSFIFVVGIAFFFISNVYIKWCSTPVMLSLNPVPTVITKEPFPAVTICNLNLAIKSKVSKYKIDSAEYAMVEFICNREFNMSMAKTQPDWKTLENVTVETAQRCWSLLLSCRFGAINYNCTEIFRPIITDCGLCCVFNMLHPKFMYIPRVSNVLNVSYTDGSQPVHWDPEKGYPKDLPPKYYPRTAAGTGEHLGFTVVLNVEADEYYCSAASGRGFKIYLHNPTERPHVKDVGLFIAPGTENKLRIRAQKFETDNKLRSMPREYRHCLFDSEKDLKYFAYYSKRNCEMECFTRAVAKRCGCLRPYMPKIFLHMPICGIQGVACYNDYIRMSRADADWIDCSEQCSENCFDLAFEPDLFSIPLSHDGFSVAEPIINNISAANLTRNIAIVHMFYKENTFRSSIQTEYIGITDFLSNTGGLMGLFVGFSFISLAEFIYYGFMRPLYNRKRVLKDFRNPQQKRRHFLTLRRQKLIYTLQQRQKNQYNLRGKSIGSIVVVPENDFNKFYAANAYLN